MLKKLRAYTYKQITEAYQILQILEHEGMTVSDLAMHKKAMEAEWMDNSSKKSFVAKPIRKCPKCGGTLKVFSLKKSEVVQHPGMLAKWECCKTCTSKSCGYVEYTQKTVEQIIKEATNGTT